MNITRYPREIETIDITPTWSELLPTLIEVATNGATLEGRRNAMTELKRMARAADLFIESCKKESTTDEA